MLAATTESREPRSLFFFRCLALLALLAGCTGGGLPDGWQTAQQGTGPKVRWDLYAKPLPEIPLPNDVATWPDPTSPTGRRVNASLIAPTGFESRQRALIDQLDGFGTYAPITVSFDAPIDTRDLVQRQGGARFGAADWPNHAIYLVDLETGVPVPLDVNGGNFQYALRQTDGFWDNDPHAGDSNLLFETVDEDTNQNGVLDPGEDVDHDGVLDQADTFSGHANNPLDSYDQMTWFYERQTHTLMLRPIVPLREEHTYAVVLTDRLQGLGGQPVRSPFPYVHHVSQKVALERLPSIFAAHPDVYGSDLASRGWGGVAFAWSFTTESITGDLRALRDGIYGRGPFARLATQFPPDLTPVPAHGASSLDTCDPVHKRYIVTVTDIADALRQLGPAALGLTPDQIEALIQSYDSISHFVLAFYETPYLLGDPNHLDLNETWHIDRATGEARISRDMVPMLIAVPKETAQHHQPFPVAFYGHGYMSTKLEALLYMGFIARQGMATVAIDAQGHGLGADPVLQLGLEAVLDGSCLHGFGVGLTIDRSRDLNGDRQPDSGANFWSSYAFHTRDVVRQSVLDYMQAIRILRNFRGAPDAPAGRPFVPGQVKGPDWRSETLVFDGDTNGDGTIDMAGDFDGDGVPDIGGWNNTYAVWGESLGGILSGVLAGAEPAITAAAPTASAGGLVDVGLRSLQGGVREAVLLRAMGPLVISRPSEGPGHDTACAAGERSLRFIVPDLNNTADFEFACIPASNLREGDVVRLDNLVSGTQRCAAAGTDGRFRLGIPADIDDPLQVEIFTGGADRIDFGTCVFEGPPPEARDVVTTFRSGHGTGAGRCPGCSAFEGQVFWDGAPDDPSVPQPPLVSPVEGLGFARQTPDFRRFFGLAQMALDPADPINWAGHVFLDPLPAADVPAGRTRSVLVLNTVGDMAVPVSAGNAYARAAGILPFMPPDAPDVFAEWRAPASVMSRWGVATPNEVLIDHHVFEGIPRLAREPAPGAPDFLFDPDDLSDGMQRFAADGTAQVPTGSSDPSFVPNYLDPPLRWVRESRPMRTPSDDVWSAPPGAAGISGVLNAMIVPDGYHGFDTIDPTRPFDEFVYLSNLVGWYLASGGTDLPYHSNPSGHHCLEDSSCTWPPSP